jgi:RHS repeat-associated protein
VGGETTRSWQQGQQPHRYASYERDGNGNDQAMYRQYHSYWQRFDQPDPYDGSYNATDPQSLNRYSYVQNDPVNFVDPTGLNAVESTCHLLISGNYSRDGDDIFYSITGVELRCFGGNSGSSGGGDNFGGGEVNKKEPLEPDELALCNSEVQKQLKELDKRRRNSSSGGTTGREYGFRVDRVNGNLVVGDIIEGQEKEVNVPVNVYTIARIHTHPTSPFPSPQDRENAKNFHQKYSGYVSTVATQGRITMYNPQVPKNKSGSDRIVDLKCP